MADEKISLEIFVEADKADLTLGQLEDGFEQLQEKLKNTNRNTEEGRKEFKKLASQMAQTSKEIKNIELSFEGLDREQVASEIGSVAGAVGDLSASLFLLGGENETLAQTALNIEKAMRVSMGLKASIEGLASARKLYNNLLRQANEDEKEGIALTVLKTVKEKVAAVGTWMLNAANKALNTTMKMNPIGLVITALTLVVGAIIYFKDEIWSLIKTALKPFQLAIDAVVDALQWLGIMESDSVIATREAEEAKTKAVQEASKKRVESYQNEAKEIEALSDIRKQAAKSAISDIDREIALAKAQGKSVEELTIKKINAKQDEAFRIYQEDLKLFKLQSALIEERKKIDNFYNQEKYDEDREREDSLYRSLVASGEALDEANNQVKIFEATREANTKKAEEEASKNRKAQREKDKAEANKQLIEDAKALAEFEEEQAKIKIQLIQDEGERARAEIEYNTQLELEALEKKGQLTFDAEMLIAQKKHKALADLDKAEDDKRLAAEKEAQAKRDEYEQLLFDAKIANEQEETERQKLKIEEDFQNNIATLEEQGLLTTELEIELTMAREKALADIELERIETVRQANLAATQERLESASQIIGAIGSLNSAALATDLKNAGNNEALKEKLRKASFEREKKLNIAMALVNGAQAQMSILAQTPKVDFGIATAIAMAAAAVTTIAQIAAIKATSYQGGGSPVASESQNVSAGGAGAAGGGSAITPVTNTSTILGNQQVFVTETDITNTQNNVSVIEESATF